MRWAVFSHSLCILLSQWRPPSMSLKVKFVKFHNHLQRKTMHQHNFSQDCSNNYLVLSPIPCKGNTKNDQQMRLWVPLRCHQCASFNIGITVVSQSLYTRPWNRDRRSRTERTIWFLPTYPICVNALGHGPSRDDVIHDPLAQSLWHLVKFEKVTHIVEHLVVAVSVGVHLLEDGGDVPKNGGIQ